MVIVITLILWVAKIYLRSPEQRHVEVCYLPHKVARFVWVDVWGALVPGDNSNYVKHSNDVKDSYFNCLQIAGGWEWLKKYGPTIK